MSPTRGARPGSRGHSVCPSYALRRSLGTGAQDAKSDGEGYYGGLGLALFLTSRPVYIILPQHG